MDRTPNAARRAGFSLRPYQTEAIDKVLALAARGVMRLLIVLPTGAGKTIVFASIIARREGRAIVLVHRDELLEQAVDKIRQVAPHLDVGVVKGKRNEVGSQVVVASVQSLSQARLDQLGHGWGTVIIDEAHRAAAMTYRRALDHLTAEDNPLVVGVTATPGRGDGIGLGSVFEEIAYSKTIVELILQGYLCELRAVRVQTSADFSGLRMWAGELDDGAVGEALLASDAPRAVADAYVEHARDRRGLVFAPTVATAMAFRDALIERGLVAEAVSGATPIEERRAVLHRLATGETQVVTNCAVLTEGFDEPSIECVVVAKATGSRSTYVQMMGRGTRKHPGKLDCLVIDLAAATTRHDIVTMPSLTGLDVEDLEDTPVSEALRQAIAAGKEPPPDSWGDELVAQEVDLFRKRAMNWVTSGRRYVLSTGAGFVALDPDGAGWRVTEYGRDSAGTVVAEGLSLEWAQGVGEDLVRARGAVQLVDPTAAWRGRPATDKQLRALRAMKLRPTPGMTAGEASDLISARKAARAS